MFHYIYIVQYCVVGVHVLVVIIIIAVDPCVIVEIYLVTEALLLALYT